ncbi:MAG: MerR family transcriptional regulator [Actinomycetes bacterium]
MTQRTSAERPYLSIGEVLGLLLEEFPDITISKIRFLESQGLIVPERTASGYRKFYDDDVERLRYILTEQKDKFLPLRVIKDRLDTPPTGTERPEPQRREARGLKNVVSASEVAEREEESEETTAASDIPVTKTHPASRVTKAVAATNERQAQNATRRPALPDPSDAVGRPATYSRAELLELSRLDEATLKDLEAFHLVTARQVGAQGLFDEHDLAVAEVARGFADAGFDVRHLKSWKISAEREAGLFEQRVLPVLRRRSPESRQESNELLDDLSDLGGRLRAILVARAVSPLRDSR